MKTRKEYGNLCYRCEEKQAMRKSIYCIDCSNIRRKEIKKLDIRTNGKRYAENKVEKLGTINLSRHIPKKKDGKPDWEKEALIIKRYKNQIFKYGGEYVNGYTPTEGDIKRRIYPNG